MRTSFLYNFFHRETSDRSERGSVNIPEDPSEWPESWRTIEHKSYSLFAPTPLPRVGGMLLERFLNIRHSTAPREAHDKISKDTLSYILKCGYGTQKDGSEHGRTVPSAGKRYPLELYTVAFHNVDDIPPGIYHYGITEHALEPILQTSFSKEHIRSFAPNHEWLIDMNGMMVITGVFGRTTEKYGNRGYRYILLEAGHVAQNLLLAATERGTHMIPIGGVSEENIEKTVGLNATLEGVVYVLYF